MNKQRACWYLGKKAEKVTELEALGRRPTQYHKREAGNPSFRVDCLEILNLSSFSSFSVFLKIFVPTILQGRKILTTL